MEQKEMTAQQFLGLSETEARALAEKGGLTVVVQSASPCMLTNSMKMNRLTLMVQGGMVTQAHIG